MVNLAGDTYTLTSKKNLRAWESFITDYLGRRTTLKCVMVLIDSRLEPQAIDLEFFDWLGKRGIPFVLVFTKCDKQFKQKTIQNIRLFERNMLRTLEKIPEVFITSAEKQLDRKITRLNSSH